MAATDETVSVLIVEDDADDYLITSDMLARQDRTRFVAERAATYEGALSVIAEARHDVYLIDYRLGGQTGLDLIRQGFDGRPGAPVILLTGQSDYHIDLEASSLGVTDYLIKQELSPAGLERSIRYAVGHHRAVRDLARSEERYELAVRAANDGIWDWDLLENRIYYSPRWHEILGRADRAREVEPDFWFDLVHSEDLPKLQAAVQAHLRGQTPHLHSEHRMRHADGSWRWVLTRGLAIRDVRGNPTRIAGSLSDVTDRHNAELQLQHDAFHDALSGLPNRALFLDRVNQVIQRSRREHQSGCTVLFLDLDRFKLVNDSLGHAVGDQLLATLAARITAVLRPGDTVARIGGDEFTVLLDGITSEPDAGQIIARVQDAMASPFKVDGHELFVTATIGMAVSSPGLSAAELLRNADIAMYDGKRNGNVQHTVFNASMHRRIVNRLAKQNELRDAIDHDLMQVSYQPIVELATGRIRALEALARWPAGREVVAPEDFIAIAEETGMIAPLGRHVLRTALRQLADWRTAGLASEDLRVSVNVSGRQLDDPALPSDVIAAIVESGLPGSALLLEITESTLMREPERTRGALSAISSAGVGFYLDDYGTGFSSLSALQSFPVHALKIDRSFVSGIGSSDVIVRSTIALAHNLALSVVAEGIEQPHQLARLCALGCEYGQGYLFSEPLSADATSTLLREWRAGTFARLLDPKSNHDENGAAMTALMPASDT